MTSILLTSDPNLIVFETIRFKLTVSHWIFPYQNRFDHDTTFDSDTTKLPCHIM
jgi:hypothetical protein